MSKTRFDSLISAIQVSNYQQFRGEPHVHYLELHRADDRRILVDLASFGIIQFFKIKQAVSKRKIVLQQIQESTKLAEIDRQLSEFNKLILPTMSNEEMKKAISDLCNVDGCQDPKVTLSSASGDYSPVCVSMKLSPRNKKRAKKKAINAAKRSAKGLK